jgi:hypothetical protein
VGATGATVDGQRTTRWHSSAEGALLLFVDALGEVDPAAANAIRATDVPLQN